jgi:hypothetical protein
MSTGFAQQFECQPGSCSLSDNLFLHAPRMVLIKVRIGTDIKTLGWLVSKVTCVSELGSDE